MLRWIFAVLVDVLLYLTVRSFVSLSHVAEVAPASLAAVSIFFLHMPQLPDTLKVSVLVCANEILQIAIKNAMKENIFNVFMIINLESN